MAQSRPVTIALDGFGAEQGFDVLAEGARRAAADGIGVRVFGPERSLGLQGVEGIEVIPTTEWIGNEDDAVQSVRERKEASVVRAARDVAEGNAAGAGQPRLDRGDDGRRDLRPAPPQRRAAARARRPHPSPVKPVLFLDVGANVEVRAQHLVQFAFLGAAFAAAVLEIREPRVGLLTVGEEAGKGRPEIVEAHRILTAAPGINFAGNIEGGDLPEAKVDVVVTDGFTGNVALKVMEGAARTLAGAISEIAHQQRDGRGGRAAAETGAGRAAQGVRPRHHRRRDPARPARGDDRRAWLLRPRRGRQRGPDGGPLGEGRRGRADRRAAARGRRARRARRREAGGDERRTSCGRCETGESQVI